jgi:Methyltransferase domain
MPPSPFVIQWTARLAPAVPLRRRALDIPIGGGRHVPALVAAGFRVFGVDRDWGRLQDARAAGPASVWCADLERIWLPPAAFELVLVVRYLQRDLFDTLAGAVAPGGALVYETFTTRQRALGGGPTSPHHLLEPGELEARFAGRAGLEIVFTEETVAPEAAARLVVRRWS